MKRFIYILFFAVAFSALFSIRASAYDRFIDGAPFPNDYMSGRDDKEEAFLEWLGDYSTYLYLYGDKRDPDELTTEFANCVQQVGHQYGVDVSGGTRQTIINIGRVNNRIGNTIKDVNDVVEDALARAIYGPDYSKSGSGSGSGFNANQGAPSGGTSYPLSNGGRIIVNDFKVPQAPHSVDLYDDFQENNYCLLEVLSYDKYGNVIDKYYLCVASSYVSDTYSTAPFSFNGGIYEQNGRYYIDFKYPYHLSSVGDFSNNKGSLKVDVSATGGVDPADLPSIDPNGSIYYYPEGGWIDGRSCVIGHDDGGNPCIMFSDDGSILYPNSDGTFTVDGDNYYITLNYNTVNDLHKQDIADNLKAGAVYLTLLANSGSANGQDYSVILQYIADKLDENNSILTLMASDDFLSHILSLLGLAAGFMDENEITEFIPLLLSLSNKIVALLPYDCISSAMADIENTLFSGSPINDIYVLINGERYVLISASFAASCQVGVDIVKTLCALVIVYMWLISMRKKVVTF